MSMAVTIEAPAELERRGFASLVRELGWSAAVRFLQRYESGTGNYAQERATVLPDWDAAELLRRCKELEPKTHPA